MSSTMADPGNARVLKCTDELLAALRTTPVFQHFLEAEQSLETSPEIQARLRTLLDKKQAFEEARQNGKLEHNQLWEYRQAQTKLNEHPLAVEFSSCQRAVEAVLREINATISETLGLDFGQTVGRKAGGCCRGE